MLNFTPIDAACGAKNLKILKPQNRRPLRELNTVRLPELRAMHIGERAECQQYRHTHDDMRTRRTRHQFHIWYHFQTHVDTETHRL